MLRVGHLQAHDRLERLDGLSWVAGAEVDEAERIRRPLVQAACLCCELGSLARRCESLLHTPDRGLRLGHAHCLERGRITLRPATRGQLEAGEVVERVPAVALRRSSHE